MQALSRPLAVLCCLALALILGSTPGCAPTRITRPDGDTATDPRRLGSGGQGGAYGVHPARQTLSLRRRIPEQGVRLFRPHLLVVSAKRRQSAPRHHRPGASGTAGATQQVAARRHYCVSGSVGAQRPAYGSVRRTGKIHPQPQQPEQSAGGQPDHPLLDKNFPDRTAHRLPLATR